MSKSSYNKAYYYPTKLFSYDPKKYYYYICIGSRGRGKTVSAWRWVLKRFLKYGEKFVWLRLTESPIKKASRNQGQTLVPDFLLKQLGISNVIMKGTILYCVIRENNRLVTKMCGMMDAISTFYTTKGQNMDWLTNVVFDEINRESGERTTFDVTRAFINQIETIARMRKIRVFMLGNTIEDTSEILSLFNFQPREFGIYKLTRRNCIIEYLEDSEEFKKKRKNSVVAKLLEGNKSASVSFFNKSSTFVDNVMKYSQQYKPIFNFYINEYKRYGIYECNDGLYIGDVRFTNKKSYKISPFLTVDAEYSSEIYNTFYDLISKNKIYYENTLERARFIKALKLNRTILS